MIRCRLLGPVEITADGGPAPPELLWRKHLALLVYLARSPAAEPAITSSGCCGRRNRKPQARHSLNEALRVLRRALGEETRYESDARRVHIVSALSRPGYRAIRDAWPLVEVARGAANLVEGDFLEGFRVPGVSDFEDWLRQEREAWRRLRDRRP